VKLVLLHPLPLDGSIWTDQVTGLVDDWIAPTLFPFGRRHPGVGRCGARPGRGRSDHGRRELVGGSCAIEVALLAPTQVKALVLSGAKAGHRPEPALRDEALRVLSESGVDAVWYRYWKPLFGPHVDHTTVARAHRLASRQGTEAIAAGVRAFHGRRDRDGFIDDWQGPVWVVEGQHDIRPDRATASAGWLRGG
jgi:hypothetical protein